MTTDAHRLLLVAFVAALLSLTAAAPLYAQEEDEPEPEPEPSADKQIGTEKIIGVGLGRGSYAAGITGKLYIDELSAIQIFVGDLNTYGRYEYECTFGCGFGLSADYVHEFFDFISEPDVGRLFLGVGGGGYIGTFSDFEAFGLGVSGVFELGWHFYQFPLELVVDVRPILSFGDFVPGVLNVDSGFGIRYFF